MMRKYDAQKRGGEKAEHESSKTQERADQSIFINEMYCACERSMNMRSPEGECRSPDMGVRHAGRDAGVTSGRRTQQNATFADTNESEVISRHQSMLDWFGQQ